MKAAFHEEAAAEVNEAAQYYEGETNMSDKFNIGDVVQLKSGGPKMAVTRITEDYSETLITCQWFSRNKLQSGLFRLESLVKVEESDE